MANENLTEKVSVNINSSTLSQIDLLVDNGYYSNRTDFINHALRTALQQNQSTLDRIIERNTSENGHSWFVGVFGLTAMEVEKMYAEGKTTNIIGYGVMVIDDNVDPEKLYAVVKSIRLKGKFAAQPAIRAHYGIR